MINNKIKENKLINPYSLLGVNDKSSLRELKKNYYNMALLCHPDRGGDKKDMNVVCLAYNYIKEQLENITENTYEELEDEFERFCKEQESIKVPKFGNIYEETNDWIVDFNKEFDNKRNDTNEINPYDNNPFENGYGDLMDINEMEINEMLEDLEVSTEYISDEKKEPKHKFTREIIEYKDPEALPDTITYYPLDKKSKDINDYSDYGNDIKMTDYKKAFFEPEKMKEVEERDYPKEIIEYK
jgi:hypothetical protein